MHPKALARSECIASASSNSEWNLVKNFKLKIQRNERTQAHEKKARQYDNENRLVLT